MLGVILCFAPSCMAPAPVKGSLLSDFSRVEGEFELESAGGESTEVESWQSMEREAELAWRQRAQYRHLIRAIVAYDRAHALLAQDDTLEDATQRREHGTRLLLRRAHAYFLLGYMKTPLEVQSAPADSEDARDAFARGAALARQSLELHLPTRTVVSSMLDDPTPRLLEQVEGREALRSLYWYALTTHFAAVHLRGRARKEKTTTRAMFEYLAQREPGYGYGLVLGELGAHHARYGRGGGDSSASKRSFEQGVDLGPNNLMLHVMYAEHYAVRTQNAPLFDRQIAFVLDAPTQLLEEYEQENRIAASRARRLKAQRDALFY